MYSAITRSTHNCDYGNVSAVGDLFMSLIHSCQLCESNSFEYLIELQRHALEFGGASRQQDALKLSRHAGPRATGDIRSVLPGRKGWTTASN